MCGASDAAQATKTYSGGSYGTAMEKSIPLRASESQPSSTVTHRYSTESRHLLCI
ncbi:hypothetical protein BT67DRAFT_445004 [Trichocladium antarcticum]|uniref:Uncharacterized protein n=1 Tax=Trichocladium antarcticum TaxID=1450529 RepID=A0AAN6UE02_9PEZI|nr:hypothetical protein BT67DRAFT_445004 [Trichocladium antarcticum]